MENNIFNILGPEGDETIVSTPLYKKFCPEIKYTKLEYQDIKRLFWNGIRPDYGILTIESKRFDGPVEYVDFSEQTGLIEVKFGESAMSIKVESTNFDMLRSNDNFLIIFHPNNFNSLVYVELLTEKIYKNIQDAVIKGFKEIAGDAYQDLMKQAEQTAGRQEYDKFINSLI